MALVIAVSNATDLEITLVTLTPVRLPGAPPKGGQKQVTAIRLWADDPKAFMAEVEKHVGANEHLEPRRTTNQER